MIPFQVFLNYLCNHWNTLTLRLIKISPIFSLLIANNRGTGSINLNRIIEIFLTKISDNQDLLGNKTSKEIIK